MEKTKVFRLLQQLTSKEKKQLTLYLNCELFSKGSKVQELYASLVDPLQDYSLNQLSKQQIYQQLYPKESFVETKFNNLLSDLLQAAYEFLAVQKFRQTPPLMTQQLIALCREEEWVEQKPALFRKLSNALDKSTIRNASYHLAKSVLHSEQDYHQIAQEKRSFSKHLQLENDSLDLFYHIEKFRLATDMLSRSTVVNANYQCSHLDYLLDWYKEHPDDVQAYPVLNVYIKTYYMLRYPEELSHFQQLKELLNQYLSLFSINEQRTLYNYILNYCVRKINTGKSQFYHEILSLYQLLIDRKLLLQQGKLTQWTYINIITTGLRLKNYSWTEDFAINYKSALSPENRENVYTYSLVSIYFERGDYDDAMRLLHSVEFNDAFYHMAAKIIQLKIYYQEGEIDAFSSLILSTQRYLSRNRQLSAYQKKSNHNFLKVINRLFKIKQKAPYLSKARLAEQIQRIQGRIQDTNPLGNKRWLENEVQNISF